MSEFKALLAELGTMQKALGGDKDDKAVLAAAGDDKTKAAAAAAGEGDGKGGEGGAGDGDADDEMFGKAMEITLADGTKTSAFDGTKVLTALQAENAELRDQMGDMQKAFEAVVGVVKAQQGTIADQGTMLKAMQTSLGKVTSEGTGRRTMISIAEKLTPGTAAAAGGATEWKPTASTVMTKAQQMCRKGDLGWEALPRIEAFQGRGMVAPPDLMARFPELLTPVS
jgi:hypothetical protein